MVLSMTGFGSSSIENEVVKLDIEIKSLNSKFLDLSLRLPKPVQPLEMEIRTLINQKVKRGKVQLSVNMQLLDANLAKRSINEELFLAYKTDLEKLAAMGNLKTDALLGLVLNMPDVLEGSEGDLDEKVKTSLLSCLEDAISGLVEFRSQEGATLRKELEVYVGVISDTLKQVDGTRDERIDKMKKKLADLQEKHLSAEQRDSNRYEQEVIFYIERFDITEEIVRLRGHLNYFLKELAGEGSGKKLGFIAQEMGREINTIGSKANDESIQHQVVQMKDNLEKIKEQVLNIL